MMLVEQISLRHNSGPASNKNITATLGLVVHAAGNIYRTRLTIYNLVILQLMELL